MLNYYSQYQIEIIIPLTPFPTALTISARALGALWWGSSWGGWWVISVAWLELKWTRAACLSRSLTPLSSDPIKSVHIIQPYTSDQKYLIFFKKRNLLIKEEWNNLLAKDEISIKWSNLHKCPINHCKGIGFNPSSCYLVSEGLAACGSCTVCNPVQSGWLDSDADPGPSGLYCSEVFLTHPLFLYCCNISTKVKALIYNINIRSL